MQHVVLWDALAGPVVASLSVDITDEARQETQNLPGQMISEFGTQRRQIDEPFK